MRGEKKEERVKFLALKKLSTYVSGTLCDYTRM